MVGAEEDQALLNKTEYKTSYATAIVDRFIRTIKDKLESRVRNEYA